MDAENLFRMKKWWVQPSRSPSAGVGRAAPCRRSAGRLNSAFDPGSSVCRPRVRRTPTQRSVAPWRQAVELQSAPRTSGALTLHSVTAAAAAACSWLVCTAAMKSWSCTSTWMRGSKGSMLCKRRRSVRTVRAAGGEGQTRQGPIDGESFRGRAPSYLCFHGIGAGPRVAAVDV